MDCYYADWFPADTYSSLGIWFNDKDTWKEGFLGLKYIDALEQM